MRDELFEARPVELVDLYKLADSGSLYAVLDACEKPEVLAKLNETDNQKYACLLRGSLDEDVRADAPFLVLLDKTMLAWIHSTLWEEPWGIFVVARLPSCEIVSHLHSLLLVTLPNDDVAYFRFYDPRVLPRYLPTCTKSEVDVFFGPIAAYGFSEKCDDRAILFINNSRAAKP